MVDFKKKKPPLFRGKMNLDLQQNRIHELTKMVIVEHLDGMVFLRMMLRASLSVTCVKVVMVFTINKL